MSIEASFAKFYQEHKSKEEVGWNIWLQYLLEQHSVSELIEWMENGQNIEKLMDLPEVYDAMMEMLKALDWCTSISEKSNIHRTDLVEHLEKKYPERAVLSEISFQMKDLKQLSELFPVTIKTMLKTTKRKASSLASTKKQKPTPSTSTAGMSVPSRNQSVDVVSCQESESSEDEETMLSQFAVSTQPTSKTSSTTCWETKDSLCTFKSSNIPLGNYFIDLKVYKNISDVRETDPMKLWEKAFFRAKMTVGREGNNTKTSQLAQDSLLTLMDCLKKECYKKTYPGVEGKVTKCQKRK